MMENKEIATLAGGCFWCTEAIFKRLKGVTSALPGYARGHIENPTWQQVCTGITGHVEAIQIEFDPTQIPFEKILDIFGILIIPQLLINKVMIEEQNTVLLYFIMMENRRKLQSNQKKNDRRCFAILCKKALPLKAHGSVARFLRNRTFYIINDSH